MEEEHNYPILEKAMEVEHSRSYASEGERIKDLFTFCYDPLKILYTENIRKDKEGNIIRKLEEIQIDLGKLPGSYSEAPNSAYWDNLDHIVSHIGLVEHNLRNGKHKESA